MKRFWVVFAVLFSLLMASAIAPVSAGNVNSVQNIVQKTDEFQGLVKVAIGDFGKLIPEMKVEEKKGNKKVSPDMVVKIKKVAGKFNILVVEGMTLVEEYSVIRDRLVSELLVCGKKNDYQCILEKGEQVVSIGDMHLRMVEQLATLHFYGQIFTKIDNLYY